MILIYEMLFKLYKIKGKFRFIRKYAKDIYYCTGCPYVSELNRCTVASNSIEGNICFPEVMKWVYRKNGVIVYHPLLPQRYDT